MKKADKEKYALVKKCYNGEPAAFICAERGIAKSTFYSCLKPYTTTSTESGVIASVVKFVKMKIRLNALKT